MHEVETDTRIERRVHQPVRVTVDMAFTRNMGNYESMKISVGLEGSALRNETAQQTLDRIYKFVEDNLEAKFTETEEALRQAGLGEK